MQLGPVFCQRLLPTDLTKRCYTHISLSESSVHYSCNMKFTSTPPAPLRNVGNRRILAKMCWWLHSARYWALADLRIAGPWRIGIFAAAYLSRNFVDHGDTRCTTARTNVGKNRVVGYA